MAMSASMPLLPVPVTELPGPSPAGRQGYPGNRLAAEQVERGLRILHPPRAGDVRWQGGERPGSPDLGRHVERVPIGDRGRGEREERGQAGLLPVGRAGQRGQRPGQLDELAGDPRERPGRRAQRPRGPGGGRHGRKAPVPAAVRAYAARSTVGAVMNPSKISTPR